MLCFEWGSCTAPIAHALCTVQHIHKMANAGMCIVVLGANEKPTEIQVMCGDFPVEVVSKLQAADLRLCLEECLGGGLSKSGNVHLSVVCSVVHKTQQINSEAVHVIQHKPHSIVGNSPQSKVFPQWRCACVCIPRQCC